MLFASVPPGTCDPRKAARRLAFSVALNPAVIDDWGDLVPFEKPISFCCVCVIKSPGNARPPPHDVFLRTSCHLRYYYGGAAVSDQVHWFSVSTNEPPRFAHLSPERSGLVCIHDMRRRRRGCGRTFRPGVRLAGRRGCRHPCF